MVPLYSTTASILGDLEVVGSVISRSNYDDLCDLKVILIYCAIPYLMPYLIYIHYNTGLYIE